MNIKFDPNNVVIKLCMTGMSLEDAGIIDDATDLPPGSVQLKC